MQVGKYNLESLNNGKYVIYWYDARVKKNYKHIIDNIDALFDPIVDGIFEHRDNLVRMFNDYGEDSISFFHKKESEFLKNVKIPQNIKIDNGDGYGECLDCVCFELVYSQNISMNEALRIFIQKYNKYYNSNVAVNDVLPCITKQYVF